MSDKRNINGSSSGSTTSLDKNLTRSKKATTTGGNVKKSIEKDNIQTSASVKQTIVTENTHSNNISDRNCIIYSDDTDDSGDYDDDFNHRDLSLPDSRYWMSINGKALIQPLGSENCWVEIGDGRVELVDGLKIRVIRTSFSKRCNSDGVPSAEPHVGEANPELPQYNSEGIDENSAIKNAITTTSTTGHSDDNVIEKCPMEARNILEGVSSNTVYEESDESLYEEFTEVIIEDQLDYDTPLVYDNLCIVWNSLEQQLSLCVMFSNDEGYEATRCAIRAGQDSYMPQATSFRQNGEDSNRLTRNYLLQRAITREERRRSSRSNGIHHAATNKSLSSSTNTRCLRSHTSKTSKGPTTSSINEGTSVNNSSSHFLGKNIDSAISLVLPDFDPVAVGVTSDTLMSKRRILRGLAEELRRVFVDHLFASEDEEEKVAKLEKEITSSDTNDGSACLAGNTCDIKRRESIVSSSSIEPEDCSRKLPKCSHDTDSILEDLQPTPVRKKKKPLQIIEKYVIGQSIIQYRLLETFPDLFFGLNIEKVLASFGTLVKDASQKDSFIQQVVSHPAIHSFQRFYHPRVAIGLLALGDICLIEHIVASDIQIRPMTQEEMWRRSTDLSGQKCDTNGSNTSVNFNTISSISSMVFNSPFEKLCRTLRVIFGNDSFAVALQRGLNDRHANHSSEMVPSYLHSYMSTLDPIVPPWRVPKGLEVLLISTTEEATENESGDGQTSKKPPTLSLSDFERNIMCVMRLHYLKNDAFPHGGKPLLLNDNITHMKVLFESSNKTRELLTDDKSLSSYSPMINGGVLICGYLNSNKFSPSFNPKSNTSICETRTSKLLPVPLLPQSSDEYIVAVIDTISGRLLNDTLCALIIDDKILQRAVQQLFVLPPKKGMLATRVPLSELPESVIIAMRNANNLWGKVLSPCETQESKKKNLIGKVTKINNANDNSKSIKDSVSDNVDDGKERSENEDSEFFQQLSIDKLCDLDFCTSSVSSSGPLLWQSDPSQHIIEFLKFFTSIINLSTTVFSKDLLGAVFMKLFYPGLLDALSFISKHYLVADIQVTSDSKPVNGLSKGNFNIGIARELTTFLQNVLTRLNERGEEGLMNDLFRTPICSKPDQHKPLIDFLIMQLKGSASWDMASSENFDKSSCDTYAALQYEERSKPSYRGIFTDRSPTLRFGAEESSPVKNVKKIKFHGMGDNTLLLFHLLGMHDDEGQTCDRFQNATINNERESFHRYLIINCLAPATRMTSLTSSDDTGSSQEVQLAYYMKIVSSISESFIHCLTYLLTLTSLDNKELLLSRVILHPDSVVLPWVRAAAEAELVMHSYGCGNISTCSSLNMGSMRRTEATGGSIYATTGHKQDSLRTLFAPVPSSVLCGNLRFLRSILNIIAPWYSPTGNTSHLGDLFINVSTLYPNENDNDKESAQENDTQQRKSSLVSHTTEKGVEELFNKGLSKPLQLAISWKDLILRSLILMSSPIFTAISSSSSLYLSMRPNGSFHGRQGFVDDKCKEPATDGLFLSDHPMSFIGNNSNNRNSSIFTPYLQLYTLKGGPRKTSAFHCTLRSILCLLESDVDNALLPANGCHSLQRVPGGTARMLPSYSGVVSQSEYNMDIDTCVDRMLVGDQKQNDAADEDVEVMNRSFFTPLGSNNEEVDKRGTSHDNPISIENSTSDPAIFLEKLMFSVLSRISILSSYRRAMLAIYSGTAAVCGGSFCDSIVSSSRISSLSPDDSKLLYSGLCNGNDHFRLPGNATAFSRTSSRLSRVYRNGCSAGHGSLSSITAVIPEPFRTVWTSIEDNTIRRRVDTEISESEMAGMQELHIKQSGVVVSSNTSNFQTPPKKLEFSNIDESVGLKQSKLSLSNGYEDSSSTDPVPERLLLIATIRRHREEVRHQCRQQQQQLLVTYPSTKKREGKDTREVLSPPLEELVNCSPPRETGRFASDSPFRPRRGSSSTPIISNNSETGAIERTSSYGSYTVPLMAQAGAVDELPADLPAIHHHGHSHDGQLSPSASSFQHCVSNEAAMAALTRCSPHGADMSQRKDSPTCTIQGRLPPLSLQSHPIIAPTTTNINKTYESPQQAKYSDCIRNTMIGRVNHSPIRRTQQEGTTDGESTTDHQSNSHIIVRDRGNLSPIPASPPSQHSVILKSDEACAAPCTVMPSNGSIETQERSSNKTVSPSPSPITETIKPSSKSSSATSSPEIALPVNHNNKAHVKQPCLPSDRPVSSSSITTNQSTTNSIIRRNIIGVRSRQANTVSPRPPPGSPSYPLQARTPKSCSSPDLVIEVMKGRPVNGGELNQAHILERATSAPADVCKKVPDNNKNVVVVVENNHKDHDNKQAQFSRSRHSNTGSDCMSQVTPSTSSSKSLEKMAIGRKFALPQSSNNNVNNNHNNNINNDNKDNINNNSQSSSPVNRERIDYRSPKSPRSTDSKHSNTGNTGLIRRLRNTNVSR